MCIKLGHIKDNSISYRSHVQNAVNTFPCGHCIDCRLTNQDEWSLRCIQEIIDNDRRGGKSVFVTLTYSREYLRFLDTKHSGWLKCFSYEDITYFTKTMRSTMHKSADADDMRYFITSEYGGQTGRPHYHALLMFGPDSCRYIENECKINKNTRKGLTQKYKDFIQNYWKFGMCRWSKCGDNQPGIFVTSHYAADYVTKYVTKDLSFEQELRQRFASEEEYKEFKKENYRSFPRHYQSRYFGDSLLENLMYEDVVNGISPRLMTVQALDRKRVWKVPKYLLRKLTHDFDKSTMTWTLNDWGRELKIYLEKHNRRYVIDHYRELLSFEFITSKISSCYKSEYFSILKDLTDRDIDFEALVMLEQFKHKYTRSHELFEALDKKPLSWFKQNYERLFRITVYRHIDAYRDPDSNNGRFWSGMSYAGLSAFRDVASLLSLFSRLHEIYTMSRCDASEQRIHDYEIFREQLFKII